MTSSSPAPGADPGPLPLPAPPRHRWKVLAAGVIANAAFSVVFSGIPMTAILMRSGYQLDTRTLGLALGLMGLGIALSELPWGLLTDRWGDRPVLLLGLCGTAVALAAMALWASPSPAHIPPFGLLAGGLVLVGLLGGSVNGASGRAVMGWFAEGERGLAMSIRQTAVPLGGAIGAPLLTGLATHAGFAAVYGVLAALCLGAAAFAPLWIQEPPQSPLRGKAAAPDRAATPTPSPLSDLQAWRMAAGIGILCAPQFAVLSFGTVFLHDHAQLGLGAAAAVMSVVQLASMALRIWSGRWTDRHRNRPAFLRACCQLTLALFAGLAVLSWAGHPAGSAAMGVALMVMLGICGICVSAWHGVAYTQLAGLAGAARAGTALGMANTSVFAVCFLVPLAIPHLLSAQGWGLVWACAAACAGWAMQLFARAGAIGNAKAAKTPNCTRMSAVLPHRPPPIMTIAHWLVFCGVSLLMCFTPGPAVLLAISNSVDVGARRTALSSLGSSVGIFVVSGLAMIGMGTILAMSAHAFLAMKVAGAMYLIWLGVKRWRSKDGLLGSDAGLAPTQRRERRNWQLVAQGMGVSLTNPKAILFFSALFPQFVVPGEPLLTQYLVLTTTFAVCALISHACYVLLISLIKGHLVAHAKLFNRIVGGTFIALGVGLLRTRHKLG